MKNKIVKNSLVAILWGMPLLILAAPKASKANPNFYPDLMAYLVGGMGGVVILAGLYSMYRLLSLTLEMKEIELHRKLGLPRVKEAKVKKDSWWKRFNQKMTDLVPLEKEKDILLDHNYDGIRELDNNLPPWWVYGFYLTIGFSVFYIGFYHFSSHAKSSAELYAIEMEQANEAVERHLAKQANRVDESNVTFLTDEQSLAGGKAIFNTLCVACHLESGGGGPGSVGPNLTDKYWLHGGSIKDVFKTIKYGVPDKGMISWKTQIRPVDMHKVASYVLSLQGTNPPNAKAPQGELYEREE